MLSHSILEFLINCNFMVSHKRAKPSYIARHIFCNHGWIKIMLNCFMPWGWVNSKNIISLCMLMGFTVQKTKRVKLQQKIYYPKWSFFIVQQLFCTLYCDVFALIYLMMYALEEDPQWMFYPITLYNDAQLEYTKWILSKLFTIAFWQK